MPSILVLFLLYPKEMESGGKESVRDVIPIARVLLRQYTWLSLLVFLYLKQIEGFFLSLLLLGNIFLDTKDLFFHMGKTAVALLLV